MGDKELLKEIGLRINARRKELKLTQEDLAENIDVSIQMISNLELGKKAVRPENIVKLCSALNVSADYILRGTRADHEYTEMMDKYRKLSTDKQLLIDKLIDSLL